MGGIAPLLKNVCVCVGGGGGRGGGLHGGPAHTHTQDNCMQQWATVSVYV